MLQRVNPSEGEEERGGETSGKEQLRGEGGEGGGGG